MIHALAPGLHPDRTSLYGDGRAADRPRLERLLHEAGPTLPAPPTRLPSQKDAVLIVYPDQLTEPGRPPLAVLKDFSTSRFAM